MDIGLGDQSFKKGITQYTFFALCEKKTGQGKGALRSYPLDPLPRIGRTSRQTKAKKTN